jgi:hypothetical protein
MPRRFWYWLGSAGAIAALVWRAWPDPIAGSAIWISRVNLVAVASLLAVVPPLARRRFGPPGGRWTLRAVRMGGYAIVVTLMLLISQVRLHLSALSGTALAGLWAGEVVFVVVLAGYLAALLAVTSQRTPARPATLTIGTAMGAAVGVAAFVLRPLAGYVHDSHGWTSGLADVAVIALVLAILVAVVKTAIMAARRTTRQQAGLPLAAIRSRQGFVAGLSVGISAAVLVSLLGIATIALAPHTAGSIQWTLPGELLTPARGRSLTPDFVSVFQASFSEAGAGYLLVLIFFPLLGAGLGAWGGLFAADNPGTGGGGGGHWPDDPDPVAPPPGDGGLELDEPGWDPLEEFPELAGEPERELTGVG